MCREIQGVFKVIIERKTPAPCGVGVFLLKQ